MSTYRVLVTDTIADSGLEIFQRDPEIDLDYRPGLKGAELHEAVSVAEALVTRSGTAVTPELLDFAKKLRVVGRAGVGLDNVDVDAATARGILVINAPTANIVSATEHTMALLLSLCRNVPEAHRSTKAGEWTRSKFMGIELYGKTLGVIGLGRIGSRVAVRAAAFGMDVVAYDPYIAPAAFEKAGAKRVPLEKLLEMADFVTVHTPLTDETSGMIGTKEFARMRDGAVVMNCARGGIYEEKALADALTSGKLSGAAVDVFEKEPPGSDHPLLNAPNVILTPHIGANTIEAQDRVAVQTAEMVVDALKGSIFVSAVNLPFEGRPDSGAAPMISLAEKCGLIASQLLTGPVVKATIELWGVDESLTKILSIGAIKGLLEPHLNETVNFVNAQAVAQQRGIDVATTIHPTPVDYTNLINFCAESAEARVSVSGTLFSHRNQRIVALNGFRVEFKPAGSILYMVNNDVPGVVGKVGTILGDRDINIAEYNLARAEEGGLALAVVSIDTPLDGPSLAFLQSLKEMREVRQILL
jgi:D-3-phosphoglycerate dehydrogenase